jgi:DNA-binding response OmpR family regulator
MRILVVDDTEIIRQLLADALTDWDIEVHACEKLAEAKARCGEGYDWIILDERFPEGSGLEFLREIKETGACETPVVILSTCASDPGYCSEALEAGAVETFAKPVSLTRLARFLCRDAEKEKDTGRLHT